ncbi:MAG: hypothetical protein JXB38_15300 [Anaerolineales bacterium]|nr:hypothetical protein [Anaerolineales bacterium]
MTIKSLETSLAERIKRHILTAWQDGHGGSAEQIHLLLGEEGLVLLIPKALYKAEVALTRDSTNGIRVLDRYLRTLLSAVADEYVPLIEECTQQVVEDAIPLVDLRAGWITIFYRFKKI